MDVRLNTSIDKLVRDNKFKKINTPSFIFDINILKDNYQLFKKSINLGNCSIRYAMKANNEPNIIAALKSLGSGFEIASKGELEILKKQSISPNLIFFSSPVKIPDHISYAYSYGIRHFAFDSYSELQKISKYAPNSSVYLRIQVSNYGATWKLDQKFGADKKDWIKLFEKAKSFGLHPEGITFHVGWNNSNIKTWRNTLNTVSKLIGTLNIMGIKIKFINIGGGFPAHQVDQIELLKTISSSINPILIKLSKKHKIKVFAEPGTFLVANCGFLLTKIYAKIKRGNIFWLYVDTPMTNGFYWILTGLNYEISTVNKKYKSSDKTFYNVTGPTCDSQEIFQKKIKLPKHIEVGDFLTVSPAGAYISSAREYNSFPYPKTEFIE